MALMSAAHHLRQREFHRAQYGVSGWKWAVPVMYLAGRVGARTVLDYGSGKGTLVKVIGREIEVREYDPITAPGTPEPADLVVCTDVLENVERDFLDDVLDHIKALAQKAVFIVAAIHPEYKRRDDLIIAEPEWWLPQFRARWPAGESRLIEQNGTRRVRFSWPAA